MPTLTVFVARCYGERHVTVLFPGDSGEDRLFLWGTARGHNGTGHVLRAAAVGTLAGARGIRTTSISKSLPTWDDISIGMAKVTFSTVEVVPFF